MKFTDNNTGSIVTLVSIKVEGRLVTLMNRYGTVFAVSFRSFNKGYTERKATFNNQPT